MSAVLLDVLGPSEVPPTYGEWDVPIDYSGFKHLSIKGCLRTDYNLVESSFSFLDSAMNVFPSVNCGRMQQYSTVTVGDVAVSGLNFYTAGLSDLFPTFIEINLFDFSTSDSLSSGTFKATTPFMVTSSEEIINGYMQFLFTDQISYLRLSSNYYFDLNSEIKIFGYRG